MALTRQQFEEKAHADPYGHMDEEDRAFIAEESEIACIDAANDPDLPTNMTWGERHIGGGLLCVTDYGTYREECDTVGDVQDFIREKIRDSIGPQYLKVMDEEKERVAETLVVLMKADGYVVGPWFEPEE